LELDNPLFSEWYTPPTPVTETAPSAWPKIYKDEKMESGLTVNLPKEGPPPYSAPAASSPGGILSKDVIKAASLFSGDFLANAGMGILTGIPTAIQQGITENNRINMEAKFKQDDWDAAHQAGLLSPRQFSFVNTTSNLTSSGQIRMPYGGGFTSTP